jgi:uncharacterized protein YxjI
MYSTIFPRFFEGNHYFIDEKVGLLKFSNNYKVYDEQGNQLGDIVQKVSGWHKFLRLLFNKAMFPFTLHINDMQGSTQAVIKRGWTFFMSKIQVLDPEGNVIGNIRQKFKFFKPTFRITDSADNLIATITGDWRAWNFSIKQPDEIEIGTISKKWNGFLKEAFTTADKYNVSIVPEYAEDLNKIVIVSSAITIDMVLKESK